MKRKLGIVLLACISLSFFSCKKFSNGDTITQSRQMDKPFQIIEMRDNVNVTLKHCDPNNPAGKVVITTGENLIDNISTDIEQLKQPVAHDNVIDTLNLNKLIIRNGNTLDFLRPYDYTLEMTVYYDSLLKLIFNSNATITTDTLRGYNFWTDFSSDDDTLSTTSYSLMPNLLLDIDGGSGEFTVFTNCYRLLTQQLHGTANIHFCGYAERAETYGGSDSHGIIDGQHLEANVYHTVHYAGTNTVIAKAFNQINVKNENIGRVFYVKFNKTKQVIIPPHMEDGHWVLADTVPDSTFHCPLRLNINGDNVAPYTD